MKVIAAEVAAHLGMLTRKAATESRATTGEMASAELAAHAGAAEPAHVAATEPAHASVAEPAHVSATHVAATEPTAHVAATEPAAHMSAPETPAVSTPTTVSTPASPAARERVSGQSPGESGSRTGNIVTTVSSDFERTRSMTPHQNVVRRFRVVSRPYRSIVGQRRSFIKLLSLPASPTPEG